MSTLATHNQYPMRDIPSRYDVPLHFHPKFRSLSSYMDTNSYSSSEDIETGRYTPESDGDDVSSVSTKASSLDDMEAGLLLNTDDETIRTELAVYHDKSSVAPLYISTNDQVYMLRSILESYPADVVRMAIRAYCTPESMTSDVTSLGTWLFRISRDYVSVSSLVM